MLRFVDTNLGSGEVAATLECTSVLFDLEARTALTIPESMRRAAEQHLAGPAPDQG